MKTKRGFTLIELLVVIAIIALLLAILMPSLGMVKEKAKFIVCKTNMKSYYLAMSLYLNESGSKYPGSFNSLYDTEKAWADGYERECHWHIKEISPAVNPKYEGPLWNYLETMKASICPTFKSFAKLSEKRDGTPHTNDNYEFNPQYAFSQNAYLGDGTTGVLKDTQVNNPGGIVLAVEETIFYITDGAPTRPLAQWILNDTNFKARHPLDSSLGDTIATYHETTPSEKERGKGNAVFVDGHTELCDPWDTEIIGGQEFRRSYLLSFPKRGARNAVKPY